MTGSLYRVHDNRLWRGDEELVGGPIFQLDQFARVLNAADPDDMAVPATLRELINMTRDCSFSPGVRLLQDGTPLRMIRPQKPKDRPKKRRTARVALTEAQS